LGASTGFDSICLIALPTGLFSLFSTAVIMKSGKSCSTGSNIARTTILGTPQLAAVSLTQKLSISITLTEKYDPIQRFIELLETI
jgi:hypothetical protein